MFGVLDLYWNRNKAESWLSLKCDCGEYVNASVNSDIIKCPACGFKAKWNRNESEFEE